MNYIAVDCGKYDTKTAFFADGEMKRFKFRTKIGPGLFEDDMVKKGTAVIQVDGGDVLLFGYGAPAEPSMETTKKTDVHRTATIASIAFALGAGEHSGISVCIGMPLDIASNPAERMSYKDFILGPDGSTHTVRWRMYNEDTIKTTTFSIGRRFVYPEGCGALWLFPEECIGSAAVIDIGNLNTNNIYSEALSPEDHMCFTGELGGQVLISGIAQALEAELGSRVVTSMVAQVMTRPLADRHLISAKGDKEAEEKSARIITSYARRHVNMIREQCNVHHWPLDFARVICVGGTTRLIGDELREVFGDTILIPDSQEYVNVTGFLRRMCATLGVDTGTM